MKNRLKVHLIQVYHYRKRVRFAIVAYLDRDFRRQTDLEREADISMGKISSAHLQRLGLVHVARIKTYRGADNG